MACPIIHKVVSLEVPVAVEVVRIWHIAKDGVSTAYPESKLKGKGKGKHNIAPDSLVWTEGFPAWKSASDVPELADLFN